MDPVESGRGDWIRTSDIPLPKRTLYQAEPRPGPDAIVARERRPCRPATGSPCQAHHVVERRVGCLAERPLGDVLTDYRAMLEPVSRPTARDQHVVVVGMAIDDEVLVGGVLQLADPGLDHRLILERGKAEREIGARATHFVGRDDALIGVGVE